MMPFKYSSTCLERNHGPSGYSGYASYRDWLRDDFLFRCVYCLHREQWDRKTGRFHIDHFLPVSHDPAGEFVYENLFYACSGCNLVKQAVLGIPNPCEVPFGKLVSVAENGEIWGLDDDGKYLIKVLRLDNSENNKHRSRWIRIIHNLQESDPELCSELMGFPDDLPDLRKSDPPKNSKPDGVHQCCFVQREKGILPTTYD